MTPRLASHVVRAAAPNRVLFVHPNAQLYGADRSLLLLVGGLADRGWHPTVLLPERGVLAGDLEAAGAHVELGPVGVFRRVFSPVRWLWELTGGMVYSIWITFRLARRNDIVHINTTAIVGAALGAWLARRPIVLHIRESYAEHPRAWRVYGALFGRMSSVLVANSVATARQSRDIGFGDKTIVVYNGLPFRPPPTAATAREGVVAVGRMNSWRGQDVLVDAIGSLHRRGIDARLAIAGDAFAGGERFHRQLVERVEQNGVGHLVELLGFVDDVPDLLRRSAIFVNPAIRPEPFGLALVEAMAEGLACIATAAGGPVEIIRPNVTGILVPPGDVEALAAAIASLLAEGELRTRLGQAAAADVRERFSIEQTVDGIEDVYRRVLRAGGDAPTEPTRAT